MADERSGARTDERRRGEGASAPGGDARAQGPTGGARGDAGLLEILEAAIQDERAAQEKYRRGRDGCADPEARSLFDQLLREEEAHERALSRRYAEVKKRIGLSGVAGRGD